MRAISSQSGYMNTVPMFIIVVRTQYVHNLRELVTFDRIVLHIVKYDEIYFMMEVLISSHSP